MGSKRFQVLDHPLQDPTGWIEKSPYWLIHGSEDLRGVSGNQCKSTKTYQLLVRAAKRNQKSDFVISFVASRAPAVDLGPQRTSTDKATSGPAWEAW